MNKEKFYQEIKINNENYYAFTLDLILPENCNFKNFGGKLIFNKIVSEIFNSDLFKQFDIKKVNHKLFKGFVMPNTVNLSVFNLYIDNLSDTLSDNKFN